MKKEIIFRIVFTVFLFNYINVFSQTNIPGGNVSGIWTVSGSPYLIQGSIIIPNDSTLTIEPGVTVNFQGTYKLYVQGRVIAIGTATDTIIFTATDTNIGWRGIRFDNTLATNDTSKFNYCKLQYGKATGASPDDNGGAFYFYNFSKVIISICRISNCKANTSGGGIYCYYSSPTITNNTISNNKANQGGGIYCYYYSNPTISYNIISNDTANTGGGIFCKVGSSPTITNNTISNNMGSDGGGISCSQSNPTISNNTFSNNLANVGGGISSCNNSNPTITNNTISNNSADYGGGIYCYQSSPTISYNTISNNIVSSYGGGISCYESNNPTISNNSIFNNTAMPGGGGISCESSNPIISNNTISNNIADTGGGIYCTYYTPSISNNTISNNTANVWGGGICCINSNPTITNNTISNNWAYEGGGIYSFFYSIPIITNNTISNNWADNTGGGIYCISTSNPTLRNTILWGNNALTSESQVYLFDEDSDPNFYYCDVQGGTAGFELNGNIYSGIYQNNIDSDPLFILPSGGCGTGFNGVTADWSLQSISLCINAGDPSGTYPVTDIVGNPRVFDGTVDIGAYEYQGSSTIETISQDLFSFYPNPTNDNIEIIGLENSKIDIINVYGQIIKTINVLNKKTIVDLSKYIIGLYLIKVTVDNKIAIKTVMKQ